MEVIYDNALGQPDVPHRHNYYTILLVDQAKGEHLIDYNSYPFGKKEVHFVSPGQVHQVLLQEKPRGWVITFSKDFLIENGIPESFVSNINLFQSFGTSPPLHMSSFTFERLMHLVKEMELCFPKELRYRRRALGALVQLFLIYSNNSSDLDVSQLDESNAGVCLLRDFKTLVEGKFNVWHKVKQYAEAIPISAKHLSETVKQYTGLSAKQVIQDRILLESKRLLLHTTLSIKEIGYEVGFEEPLHFSAFFKKGVGTSPSQFRLNYRQGIGDT